MSTSLPRKKMFKVIVLACSVAFPSDCWEYHDTRGPYESMERLARESEKDLRKLFLEKYFSNSFGILPFCPTPEIGLMITQILSCSWMRVGALNHASFISMMLENKPLKQNTKLRPNLLISWRRCSKATVRLRSLSRSSFKASTVVDSWRMSSWSRFKASTVVDMSSWSRFKASTVVDSWVISYRWKSTKLKKKIKGKQQYVLPWYLLKNKNRKSRMIAL